jgi:hypothetical protein
MDLSELLDWIKLSPKYLLPIFLASAVLLFANGEFLEHTGLQEIRTQYRPWVGGIFLVSTLLLASHFINELLPRARKRYGKFTRLKHAKRRLHDLTPEERDILRGYIIGNTRTQYYRSLDDGVVDGLEAERIIYRTSINGWAYNIQPWAWKYLNEHPELLLTKEELETLGK